MKPGRPVHQPLLSVDDLQTYFFTSQGVVRAVDGVSLQVRENECVGVVGESGCGKSATAFSLMRLIPSPPGRIVGGSVRYGGKDLTRISEEEMRDIRGKDIAMVFQDPMTYLNPVLRIETQLAEMFSSHQPGDGLRQAIDEALSLVRIPDARRIARGYPHELSGGMRQRVLIAMAIACKPRMLIADEPTTALDVTVQAQILDLLAEVRREIGMSLILISHDLGVIAESCDRVYVMYAGGVVEHAEVFSLFENPRHPYTAGLMKSLLSVDRRVESLPIIPGAVPNLIEPPSGCRFHPRCPHRMPLCTQEPPPLFDVGDQDRAHQVACWLFKG